MKIVDDAGRFQFLSVVNVRIVSHCYRVKPLLVAKYVTSFVSIVQIGNSRNHSFSVGKV